MVFNFLYGTYSCVYFLFIKKRALSSALKFEINSFDHGTFLSPLSTLILILKSYLLEISNHDNLHPNFTFLQLASH